MGQYNWTQFPNWGVDNYYSIGKGALDEWWSNFQLMDDDIVGIKSGVNLASGAIITDKLADAAVTLPKIDYDGTATDGYMLVYRASVGKLVMEPATASGTDTYMVKMSDTDTNIGYIADKIDRSLAVYNNNVVGINKARLYFNRG